MSEWIDVRERLPEVLKDVVVLHDNGVIRIESLLHGGEFLFDVMYGKVTHWMELPPTPGRDVVEVVRCERCGCFDKETMFCKKFEIYVTSEFYCKEGETRRCTPPSVTRIEKGKHILPSFATQNPPPFRQGRLIRGNESHRQGRL